MKLTLIGHEDRYAVEQLQMSLFPQYIHADIGEAVSKLSRGKTWLTATTTIEIDGKKSSASKRILAAEESVRLRRRALQQSYYLAALPHLETVPAWGALAGVRPTKLSTKHMLEGGTPKSADKMLKDTYFVEKDRRKLAIDCSLSTVEAVKKTTPNDISLYVGIPFCPTRCAYCSFVSRTIGKRTELLEPYLEALLKELRHTGRLLATSGKTVRTIYIGGGTPTTLTSRQMETLLSCIRESFDLSRCIEFTVEGGRPDTLDQEKLNVIAQNGADRMSINPQTMEDHVLAAIGRHHNAGDIERAMVCPECGLIEYPKISPAVIVAVRNGDHLLLGLYALCYYRNIQIVSNVYYDLDHLRIAAFPEGIPDELHVQLKSIYRQA